MTLFSAPHKQEQTWVGAAERVWGVYARVLRS